MTPVADAQRVAQAIDDALERLAVSVRPLDDDEIALPARVIGASRRDVLVALAVRADRQAAALRRRAEAGAGAPNPREASRLARAGRPALVAAVRARRTAVAVATRAALATAPRDDGVRVELEALLAHVELSHVALDLGYDFADLPATSLAAHAHTCAVAARRAATASRAPVAS